MSFWLSRTQRGVGSIVHLSALILGIAVFWLQADNKEDKTPARKLHPASRLELELQERTQKPVTQLDVDLIMLGPDFAGTAPANPRWSGDNRRIWIDWKKPGEEEPGISEIHLDDGVATPRRLAKEEEPFAPPANAERDRSGRHALYSYDGDLYLLNTISKEHRRLTVTEDKETDPHFSDDEKQIIFRRGDNLFRLPLEGESTIEQLTDLRKGKDPELEKQKGEQEGQRGFLKDEQEELILYVRQQEDKKRENKSLHEARHLKPYFLGDRKVERLLLSADQRFVAVELSLDSKEQRLSQVPNYVVASGYTEPIESRTKVGDHRTRYSLVVLDRGNKTHFDVEFSAGNQEKADEKVSRTSPDPSSPESKDDGDGIKKPHIDLHGALWSEKGHRLLAIARSADNKDQWLLRIDPETKTTAILHHQHDDAWVLNSAYVVNRLTSTAEFGFYAHDERVWFTSEHSGFMQLYSVPFEGGSPQALTQGKFEVADVRLSQDQTRFYFRSNQDSPEVIHFYSLAAEGGLPQKLTVEVGHHQVTLSPDESQMADIYSRSSKPWELYVQPTGQPQSRRQLTDSPTPGFKSYPWIEPQIVSIPARDGVPVPARLYVPAKPHPLRPAVIFVHGAGYLQNVHRWWSHYYREYMFHHLLMQHGYTVLDIDYRGSAGYGRDWRTAIYRHMGGKDLSDQVDGAAYLVKHHGAQSERIGIYGGSYGGFITLMALFTQPQSFGAGAALRPVTDWAYYNEEYTSNILNLPQEDREAYTRSSPIYFAEGLEDPLLICHGLVDVNVHAQDTIRLTQRLIELRKKDFEVMLYPVEDHAFTEPSSWADEYRRILKLFETHLKKK
ncbi:MAG: prolyl oligopeptidase family serine peptidase [Acidobacteriota bacterium]